MASTRNDPLHRFPYEIWAKCIQLYARDQEEGALPLLAVCSAWEQNLLATPELWTTIYLDGGDDEECRAECFFHLSSDVPIDLVLDRNSAAMDIAIKYGDRIRSITFHTKYAKLYSSSDIRRFSHKLSIGAYPNLLRIHVEPPCYIDDLIPFSLIRACPALISIQWAYVDQTTIPSDMVFKRGTLLHKTDPIVSAAFGMVKGIFEVLKEQKEYDLEVSELADGIAGILPFATLALEPFATLALEEIPCDEAELLDAAVRNMCALTADAANFIYFYAKQCPPTRALNSVTPDAHLKIKAFRDDFYRLKKDFDHAISAASFEMSKRTEEFRLLDRLKPTDAASYREYDTCMAGTRTAILDHITAWALDRDSPPNGYNTKNIFWLYGSPGLGKTSVANSLCERLHRSGNLGGSFFCRRADPILSESGRVLPTLISKLAEMWSPYRKLVAQALQDDPQLNPESARGVLLLKLLQSVQKHPPRTLVLVVDALDECGDPSTRRLLIMSLLEACCNVRWLKVFITSRPEHDIKACLESNIHFLPCLDLVTDDYSYGDIQTFTRNRLASIARSYHLPEDWPGEEHFKQIVDRSGGTFTFVETLCRYLDGPDPNLLLAQVLGGDLRGAYAELHTLYSTIITTKIGRHMDTFRSIAQAIVVVSQYRPLCDDTLASLLRLKSPMVRTLIDELSPLLYRDRDEEGGIRLRHLSIADFLTGLGCPSEFRVDFQKANAELSLCCLATMTRELKFNICELETSYLANADINGLDKLVDLKIPDALQYSCVHWSDHLCSDSAPASLEVLALLDEFFTGPRPLFWIEVMSLMGKVPLAISALRRIKACIRKFHDRHRESVDEILRFLLAFFAPISTSTPHIYISMLPFTPTGSHLWNNASQSFPNTINAYKGRMESWPGPTGVWLGHALAVRSIAYSPDGRYVVSGSCDKTIRLWDAESGAALGEPLRGHSDVINSVAYSPDGRYVVSGSYDKTIRLWDAESGAALGEPLRGHSDVINSVAYSPDGRYVVSGSSDNTIRIWDAETGEAVGESLRGHTDWVQCVAYSPDGRRIVSGSSDNTIRMWDADTGEAVSESLRGHTDWVQSVAYSPDGRRIVSGSSDDTIRIWDADTGEAVGDSLRGHTGWVESVAYSPDGRRIVSGSSDNTIRVWDAETGDAVGESLRGHTDWVESVAYSPDGRHVVSGSSDNTIRIWDAETGDAVGESLRGHTGWVESVAYSPDGRRIVSGSSDDTIRIWDAETGEAVGDSSRGHTDWVQSVAYSPDGRRIVSGSSDDTIRIWDAETGEAVGESLRGHTDWVRSAAYSPDGRHVVSGSSDNTLRMWDAETGEAVGDSLRGHTGWVRSVAYSPDGRRIVSGSSDNTIRIWDAETGEAVGESIRGHTHYVNSVAYSPDGRHVVSGSSDNTLRMWDAETGEVVGESMRGHTHYVNSVAYSPDGRHVVSGSSDNTLRMWDAETGEAVGEPLRGHTGYVYSVAYSPDGHRVVSGSEDKTIRIWDAETGVNGDGHGVLTDFTNFPTAIGVIPNYFPNSQAFVPALPGHIIPPKMLDADGYVRSAEGLLFWVPEDCRNGLTCPAIMTIPTTGRERVVRVDLTSFQYGISWTNIYAGV